MDKNASEIYIEILDKINSCFKKSNFFKGTQILVDRKDKNNIITVELTPYFYNDTMNFKLYLVYNFNTKFISLKLKHKYKDNSLYIYQGEINELSESNYDINKLIQEFESTCKEYYLAAEKYYKNKNACITLFNNMQSKEFKLL